MKYAVYKKKLKHCTITIDKNAHALYKRFDFVYNAIEKYKPKNILDIGCGSGEHLTKYIAKAFPDIMITAVDDDKLTISGINNKFKNLVFLTEVPKNKMYDMVIASEVIEHVKDPVGFLDFIRIKLKKNGIFILTLPNGYSLFEYLKIVEFFYVKLGLQFIIKAIKSIFNKKVNINLKDTNAISPHINFFSYNKITKILKCRGFDILKYEGRMFLFGFLINNIINLYKNFIELNSYLGSKLNPIFVTDWMFVLKKNYKIIDFKYKRNLYSKLKILINKKWYTK